MESVITRMGLPEQFGLTLLLLGLVLLLAPWLSGVDFGFLKVPTFPDRTRRILRILGPTAFVSAIVMHIPFIKVSPPEDAVSLPSDTEGTSLEPQDLPTPPLEEVLRARDLRDIIVEFEASIPSQAETSAGLRQYWSTLTDECTLVLRDRQFDPVTVKMNRLDTYTINFSNVVLAEERRRYGLPGIALRFFEGRGAELVRQTTDINASNPFQSETRSALIVEIIVKEEREAVAYANEIARRCSEE